jgi:hypothetical protein
MKIKSTIKRKQFLNFDATFGYSTKKKQSVVDPSNQAKATKKYKKQTKGGKKNPQIRLP